MMRLGTNGANAYRAWTRVRDHAFTAIVRGGFAELGRGSTLQLPLRLAGEEYMTVGRDVFVGAGSWLHALPDGPSDPSIVIGDGTSMAGGCVISAVQSIRIGEKVLMARNVYIADHGHAFADPTLAVLEQGVRSVRPVRIGDGAWLGQNVFVGPGVTIGRGAVVGANSVVVHDIPEHCVAVGAPARVIRAAEEVVAGGVGR